MFTNNFRFFELRKLLYFIQMKLFKQILKNHFLLFSLNIIFFFLCCFPLQALEDYQHHLTSWQENSSLASKYLAKAEDYLKEGNTVKACNMQLKASSYGVEATKSLIKAFEIKKISSNINQARNTLNAWNNLANYCN